MSISIAKGKKDLIIGRFLKNYDNLIGKLTPNCSKTIPISFISAVKRLLSNCCQAELASESVTDKDKDKDKDKERQ